MRRTTSGGSDGEVAGALRRGAVGPAGRTIGVSGRPLLRVVTGGREGSSTAFGWRRRRGAEPAPGVPGARVPGAPDTSAPDQALATDQSVDPAVETDPSAPDAGMSTVEYAVGTVVAAAFAAVLYRIVTGDSIVSGLQQLIDSALHTVG